MPLPKAADGAAARPAIVEVLGDGERRGTGFFATDRIVLTCDHVVASARTIRVRLDGGEERAARIARGLSLPAMDICALVVRGRAPAVLPVTTAPVSIDDTIWTAGFSGSAAITTPLPSTGTIQGHLGTRYEAGRLYELADVLRAHDLRADFGSSGAPVLAMPEQVAVGMTVAKYLAGDNFILPFGALVGTPLGELLERRPLPTFGRYLNAAGARLLCDAQRRAAIERLIESRQYLRDQYVAREPLERTIAQFVAQSDVVVLPVIGSSGVGKSSALARFADRTNKPFVLFLAGHRVHLEGGSLRDAVEAEIRESANEPFSLEQLTVVARAKGERLVVVLDALNEVTGTVPQLRAWIERTLTWLRSAGVRLIVSAREDFWLTVRQFIPDRYLTSERTPAALQDFSIAEVHAAVAAYGLPAPLADQPTLRRPVFLRLYADLGAKALSGRVSHARLLQAYVAEKTKQTALRLDPAVPASSVELLLERIAARADWSLSMAKADVFDEPKVTPPLVQALLSENLLLETDDGFRFLFDEVCEYLLSKSVTLPESASAWKEWEPAVPLGAVRFAILRSESADAERARRMLRSVAAVAVERGPLFGTRWRELLLDTFSRMADPPVALVRDYLRSAVPVIENFEQDSIVRWIAAAGISVPQRLELLHAAAPAQNYYPWRESDWRPDPVSTYRTNPYVHALRRAFEEDAGTTIDALVGSWLPDETRLRDDSRKQNGPASVSHIARALLYEQSGRYLDAICDALTARVTAPQSSPAAQDVLRMIASDRRSSMEAVLQRWAAEGSARDYASLIVMASRPELSSWNEERLRELARSADAHVSAGALQLLARVASDTEKAFAVLAERYFAGDRSVDIFMLTSFAVSAAASYQQFVRRLLRESTRAWDVKQAVLSLSDRRLTAEAHESLVTLLEELVARGDLGYDLGATIERELNAIDVAHPAFPRLFDLARRFVTSENREGRSPLFYFITAWLDDTTKMEARQRLTDAIIDGVRDVEDLERFRNLLVGRYGDDPAMADRIRRLSAIIGDDA